MKIEILVFDGCPNSAPAEKLVRDTVAFMKIEADIEIIRVEKNEDAIENRFLGSPSIRINGQDLEIEEDDSNHYAMRCRIYRDGDSQSGIPPRNLLMRKLKEVI